MSHANTLIDLSHTIEDGMITYKGLPAPLVCDYLSHKESRAMYEDAEFQIGKIEMISNTGTYIDCPFHRYPDGKDISETSLERFVNLPGVVVEANYKNGIEINVSHFHGLNLASKAVLIKTNWSELWQTENYFENHPYLTEEAAIYLRENGVRLAGIDSYNIDDTRTKRRPVHTVLLAEEILIVEHLCNLKSIPTAAKFTFNAVPPKIKGMGAYPVRAYAQLI